MRIKYLATYNGPSYGSFDPYENMEAFASIYEAECEMARRQTMSRGYVTLYAENDDQLYVPWARDHQVLFPSTSNEDHMDLYEAYDQGDGEYSRVEEPTYRLTVGPRGGIVREKY